MLPNFPYKDYLFEVSGKKLCPTTSVISLPAKK